MQDAFSRTSPEQHWDVLDALPDPAFVLTESGRYAAIYGGKDSRYYHDGSSLVGKALHEVLPKKAADDFLLQVRKALATNEMQVYEYQLSVDDVEGIPKQGPQHPLWFVGRISALQRQFLGEAAVVWVASNITESKRLERLLHDQAMSDDLTGLHNRRRCMQVLTAAFDAFARYSTPCSLITFDIDRFKQINDHFGHPAGDRALMAIASAVNPIVRQPDFLCRIGGDEFAVVCTHSDLPSTMEVAERIRQAGLKVLAQYATSNLPHSLSLGVSSIRVGDESHERVLQRCDEALYQSKTAGGNKASSQ